MLDLDMSLRAYWHHRLRLHFEERYKGRSLVKFPEDLRTYESVIERTQPTVIVELGTNDGGSALWFADRLRDLVGPQAFVVTVDVVSASLPDGILFIHGDLRAQGVQDAVRQAVAGRRVMVIDDSAHSDATTTGALEGYGDLVSEGCYFVVEDGIVDEPELSVWPSVFGVQPAIERFLATERGARFEREWLAPYGLTMHVGGWLRARS